MIAVAQDVKTETSQALVERSGKVLGVEGAPRQKGQSEHLTDEDGDVD